MSNFDKPHGDFGCRPRSLNHICLATCYRIGRRCTDNYRFSCDGCKPIDMSSELDLDDIAFSESLSCLGIRTNYQGPIVVVVIVVGKPDPN